jgi:hypothetical protein
MSDIVERLRREVAWEQDVGELLEEAAAEIVRLRLTDKEREAIRAGIATCEDITYGSAADQGSADILRALLERTK